MLFADKETDPREARAEAEARIRYAAQTGAMSQRDATAQLAVVTRERPSGDRTAAASKPDARRERMERILAQRRMDLYAVVGE